MAENTSEACSLSLAIASARKTAARFQAAAGLGGVIINRATLRALASGTPGENLLRLIPGIGVHRIERGCSGMAGLWGLNRENYRTSLRAGWG